LKYYYRVRNQIFLSRFECFHLGQKNYDSYIDIVWFLKRLEYWLKNTKQAVLKRKIKDTIKYLTGDYIVSKYIGSQETKLDKNGASIGAHGVSIYFPVSSRDHKDNALLRLPFSYQSKFKLNFIRKSWDEMVRKTWQYIEIDLQLYYPKL